MYYILYMTICGELFEAHLYCETQEHAMAQAKSLAQINHATEYFLKEITTHIAVDVV